MLSGETASGQLPGRVGADDGAHHPRRRERRPARTARRPARIGAATFPASFPDVISGVACQAARESGRGADRRLHPLRARPRGCCRTTGRRCPSSPSARTRRCAGSCRCSGAWCRGCSSRSGRRRRWSGGWRRSCSAAGLAPTGDRVVIVFGAPVGPAGEDQQPALHTTSPGRAGAVGAAVAREQAEASPGFVGRR